MMEEDLKYFERIEIYFDNEMSEQERIAFEEELHTNETLKHEFDVHSAIIENVKREKRAELKIMLQQAEKELSEPFQIHSSPRINVWQYAIAASLFLIACISVFFIYTTQNNSSEKLVAAYWKKDAGLPVMMDANSNASFDNAMTAYKSGDFSYAFAQLEHLNQNDTVLYYEGLCSFEIKKDATDYIKPVAENSKSIFQAKAKYYLMLLYVNAGKKDAALKLLNDLKGETEHPFKEEIQKLSEEKYFIVQ